MLKNIFNAVSMAIKAEFNEPLISLEDIEQGIITPAFVIQSREISYQMRPNGIRRSDIPLDVAYFTDSKTAPRADWLDKQYRLFKVLERVTDTNGNSYVARDMSSNVVDHVLHVMMTYTLWERLSAGDPVMEHLIQTDKAKEN